MCAVSLVLLNVLKVSVFNQIMVFFQAVLLANPTQIGKNGKITKNVLLLMLFVQYLLLRTVLEVLYMRYT